MAKKKTTTGKSGEMMGMDDLERALQSIGGGNAEGENPGNGEEGSDPCSLLKQCFARLNTQAPFKPGQLVQWKKGCKNRRSPEYGQPVIVVELLDTPVHDIETKGAGSAYFREPLTLIAGQIDKDGDFICFHYDARRFEPYKG